MYMHTYVFQITVRFNYLPKTLCFLFTEFLKIRFQICQKTWEFLVVLIVSLLNYSVESATHADYQFSERFVVDAIVVFSIPTCIKLCITPCVYQYAAFIS